MSRAEHNERLDFSHLDSSDLLSQIDETRSQRARNLVDRATIAPTLRGQALALEELNRQWSLAPKDVVPKATAILDAHESGLNNMQNGTELTRNQMKFFRQIDRRILATRQTLERDPPGQLTGQNYVGMMNNEQMWLNRDQIDKDLQTLKNDTAMFMPGSEENYARVRDHYVRTLEALVTQIHPPYFEAKYRLDNPDGYYKQTKKELYDACIDMDAVKGSVKNLAAMAVGALLVLAVIRDITNKKLSFSTLAFLGVLMFLLHQKKDFDFLAEDNFAQMTREHFPGKQGADYVRQIMQWRPQQASHVRKMLEEVADGKRELKLTDLTEPKTSTGRPQPSKAIDEAMAKKILQIAKTDPSAAVRMITNFRIAKKPEERESIALYVEKNGDSSLQREVHDFVHSDEPPVEPTDASSAP